MESLEIENMSVSYQGKSVLSQLSLTIPSKKMVGIIGPNGAGKSSLLKGILGLVPTKTGRIFYNGEVVSKQKNLIAYVEQRQEIDLTFPIDVFNVVLLGTYPQLNFFKRPGKRQKEITWQALEKVDLTAFAKRQISELSGGQLQRVFIARALAQQAPWLLLDEPFAGIDAASEKIIVELLKKLRDEGKSIVIVHHDLHKIRDYFDEVILLNHGVVAAGGIEQVYTSENMVKAYGDALINFNL
ncbi:metal ABC transporter ATP-binding protein [Enterococcus sp. AZ103]|uniref:metal ABC transporter ATP-binding protein n=1 Tax=Enterococcus sp. AZ103 TaxID=2774628 RepID=UPI003F296719